MTSNPKRTLNVTLLCGVFLFVLVIFFLINGGNKPNVLADEDKKKSELISSFDDLYDGDWEIKYVNWAIEQNIISPYSDNTIRANEEISDKELMMIIAKYVGLTEDYTNSVDKLYTDLRKLGVFTNGTSNNAKRDSVPNVQQGLTLTLGLHDSNPYKTRKDVITKLLNTVNNDKDADEIELNSELRKIDIIRILKAYESQGKELVLNTPKSSIGSDWKVALASDNLNKRIVYLEKESGLMINITEINESNLNEDSLNNYYKTLTDESLDTIKNGKYIVSIKNVGSASLDFKGLSIISKEKGLAPVETYANTSSIELNSATTITKVVTGNNIDNLTIVASNSKINVDLGLLKKLENKKFYITPNKDSSKLEFKQFYVSDNLMDIDYQLEKAFYEEYFETKSK